MDANTGEVIVAVEGKGEAPTVAYGGVPVSPSWDEVVYKLVKKYPDNFEFTPYTKRIVEYQDLSEEESKRQRDLANDKKK